MALYGRTSPGAQARYCRPLTAGELGAGGRDDSKEGCDEPRTQVHAGSSETPIDAGSFCHLEALTTPGHNTTSRETPSAGPLPPSFGNAIARGNGYFCWKHSCGKSSPPLVGLRREKASKLSPGNHAE
eukprot:gene24974-biopygen11955